MWTRKSDEEIRAYLAREEVKRKSLLRPLIIALIGAVVAAGFYSLGYRGGWLRGGLIVTGPSGFSRNVVFAGVFLFAFFFAAAVYNQRRKDPVWTGNESMLCSECTQSQRVNASGACHCGGTLEPFAFYQWVEE